MTRYQFAAVPAQPKPVEQAKPAASKRPKNKREYRKAKREGKGK